MAELLNFNQLRKCSAILCWGHFPLHGPSQRKGRGRRDDRPARWKSHRCRGRGSRKHPSMGLDMFARTRDGRLPAAVDFKPTENDDELFYWRKHPDLHGWMEALYRTKGGADDTFNCNTVALTEVDLDRLEQVVRDGTLPATTGFFFGESSPDDQAEDLRFITLAREALKAGKAVYYTSWW